MIHDSIISNNVIETKYNCDLCNYQTDERQNWYNHKKTLKHQRFEVLNNKNIIKHKYTQLNKKNIDDNILQINKMKYKCDFCNYQTDEGQSWYNHKKTLKHQDFEVLNNKKNTSENYICENKILKERLNSIEKEKNCMLNKWKNKKIYTNVNLLN